MHERGTPGLHSVAGRSRRQDSEGCGASPHLLEELRCGCLGPLFHSIFFKRLGMEGPARRIRERSFAKVVHATFRLYGLLVTIKAK
jgi:hypothetical protein